MWQAVEREGKGQKKRESIGGMEEGTANYRGKLLQTQQTTGVKL